jgi:methionine-rich copper-binding protein CopC
VTSARTWLARLTIALVVAAGFGIGVAASASAHDVLISSDPADGATLRSVPSTISFTFDQPVQNFDPVVSLIGPDGKQYATGTPQISGSVVTGDVAPGPAGAYTAAYRIVSADGHPVTGEVRFTLAAGASSASAVSASAVSASGGPAPPVAGGPSGSSASSASSASAASAASAAPAVASASSGSSGLSAGIWIGLIVAALVIAAAAVVLLRRPPGRGPRADKDY